MTEKADADYRYRLIRIYERREEIAVHGGEKMEQLELRKTFGNIKNNFFKSLKTQTYVNVFSSLYSRSEMFVPLFIIGPTYFAGAISLGVLMQIRGMFSQVYNSLAHIAYSSHSIYQWIASAQRIVEFTEKMENSPHHSPISTSSSQNIIIKDFVLSNRKHETVWHVPDITINKGERKILMAPSGRGKTSLLRAMKGIGHHRIPPETVFVPEGTVFSPQRPYMPLGTLRQCLIYPLLTAEDDSLISLMQDCHLAHLVPLLEIEDDYQNRLSLGEQQRINFVRVLLQKPKWLVMDEPTSSLNDELADSCVHILLTKLPQAGIFIISHKILKGFDEIIEG